MCRGGGWGWGGGGGGVSAPFLPENNALIKSNSDTVPKLPKIKSLLPSSLNITASAPQLPENGLFPQLPFTP